MLFQVFECAFQSSHRNLFIITNFSFACAEAAINSTLACNQEQRPVRIPVCNIWNRAHFIFPERVFFRIKIFYLVNFGNTLKPDWISGIPDKAEVIWIYPCLEEFIQIFRYLPVNIKAFNELVNCMNTIPHHFLPKFHDYPSDFLLLKYLPKIINASPAL